jgi:hypothetical protein
MNMKLQPELKIIGSVLVLLICSQVSAQNMNSPYSIYGIGDLDYKSYNRTSGMSGTGMALKSSTWLVNNNPASITGLERSYLVVTAATAMRSSTYQGNTINSTNNTNSDFWVKGISIGTKINKFWASNLGFQQFSNVNYRFSGSKAVEGSGNIYSALFEGDGGLTEYYWINAIQLGKHFSVGVRSSFIGGAINQSETLYEPTLGTTIVTTQKDYFNNFRFQYGGLYTTTLGKKKKWDLSLGARYASKTRLAADRSLTVTQDGSSIVEDRFIKKDRFWLPETYSVGLALTKNKKTTYALDYTYEDWSSLNIKDNGWRLINSHRLSGGVQFSKLIQYRNQTIEKSYFQLGGFVSNSYLQIGSNVIKDYGFSAGMGGWLGSNLLYSLSGEFGVRGTKMAGLIKENYFQLTFTISYRDFLFSKGRKYD